MPDTRFTSPGLLRARLGVAAGLLGAGLLAAGGAVTLSTPAGAQRAAEAPMAKERPTSYADVVQPAMEAVVNVRSEKRSERRRAPGEPPIPWLRPAPDGEDDARRRSESQGSGVIVRSDGIILTNNHVVEDSDEVWVSLADRRELKAEVVGTDPATDIAVLRVSSEEPLPSLPIGRSTNLEVGDIVFAIGNPFRLSHTVTMGIVSATGRTSLGILGEGGYENFIQTDASINPGNSGGALITAGGELVGINTAIFTGGMGGNQGIGFAIPMDMAARVMAQLLETGEVQRALLGVVIEDIDAAVARKLGFERPRGARVRQVAPGSPAEAAGITAGDVILAIDGRAVDTMSQLRLTISNQRPGERVALGIMRGDERLTKTVRLGSLDTASSPAGSPEEDIEETALRGLTLGDLDAEIRESLGLDRDTRGVVVTEVTRTSPAARAGVQAGDVIVEIDREPIDSVSDFRRALRDLGQETVFLLIQREGGEHFITVRP